MKTKKKEIEKSEKPSLGKKKGVVSKGSKPVLGKKKHRDEESSEEPVKTKKVKKPEMKAKDKSGKKVKPGLKKDGSGEATRYAQQSPPEPRTATPEQMEKQRQKLVELGFINKKLDTLKGLKLVREFEGKKYVIVGKSNGWLLKNTGDVHGSLYSVVCAIVKGTRPAYAFLKSAFEAVK